MMTNVERSKNLQNGGILPVEKTSSYNNIKATCSSDEVVMYQWSKTIIWTTERKAL
jgi:hypothetical protein